MPYLCCMSARPFTEAEYSIISQYFTDKKRTRDKLLLVLGAATGYRIQELTSLTVGQVWDGIAVTKEVTISRRDLKGGCGVYMRSVRSRRVPLSDAVRAVIGEHLEIIGADDPSRALFATGRSQPGAGIDRSQAFRILVAAATACGIDATRISTHSLRKTFARRIFEASGRDLIRTQRIIGHANPMTTARYLETDSADLDRLVLNLAA